MIDYALWKVIENGNTAPTTVVEGVEKIIPPTTAEEKARSTLMMGIPNEHQLKFNSIKDAKLLLEAIKKRFGGNAAIKKTQRNILKQPYENFTAPSSETLDQTFDRLQKLVSQLEILGETLSQEDVNQKLLRSLSPEWNTLAVVWRNKPKLETISLDDLYNNLKVYEPEVKWTSSTTLAALMKQLILLMNQPSSPQLANKDLQQLYPDDLEEIDLRWQMAMLTMRARRNMESSKRSVQVETTTSNALISCDGLGGYDWSDHEGEGPTNYALMAYSSSSSDYEVSNDSTCSKSYLETVESVEERLKFYKKNESVYVEKINGLKWDIQVGEITIGELRKKLEIVQKEKDGIQFNVDKFENASKSLNKIIESQIVDNCKKGLGYNAVPPPLTGNFMPPKPDLSFTGLEEFTNEPVVIKPVVENSEAKASEAKPKAVRKNNGAPIIKDWVSDSEEENVSQTKIEKKTAKPSFVKIDFVKAKQTNKTDRKTAKQVDCNYQRVVKPVWNNAKRVNHQNFAKKTYPYPKKNMVLRTLLMKSGLVSINTTRQNISKTTVTVNTARQVNTVHSKTTVNAGRPMVNIGKDKNVNAARPKVVVNAARPKAVVNAVKGNNVNAVKASAC
ncbi:hypothetical protein Tco_1150931 [Tanacetum coccineum]